MLEEVALLDPHVVALEVVARQDQNMFSVGGGGKLLNPRLPHILQCTSDKHFRRDVRGGGWKSCDLVLLNADIVVSLALIYSLARVPVEEHLEP